MRLFPRIKRDEIKNKDTGHPAALTFPDQTAEDKLLAQKIKKRFTAGVSHKQSLGLYEDWAEYERFWNSDQWPDSTPDTRDLPRPVTNHFASIIEQKVAGLTYEEPEIYFEPVGLSQPVPKHEIIYPAAMEENSGAAPPGMMPEISGLPGLPAIESQSQGAPLLVTENRVDQERIQRGEQSIDAADLLSHIAKHQATKIEFTDLLDTGVRTAALLGTAIWYMPWDNTIIGGSAAQGTAYIGDIAGYEIDPTNFFPGDPTIRGIQQQPWVILAERRPLEEVREFYREYAPEIVDLLQPEERSSDTQTYDQERVELSETDYIDILHCWWKEKEGYKTTLHYAVECQGFLLRHEDGLYKHSYYPFAAFQWYPTRKSFWGKPESADLIANQKEENRLAGISLLAAYGTGMPNARYKPEYVSEEDIPIGPGGGVIPDKSPPGHWGIDYMHPPSPSAHIPQLRETLIAGIKDASGVHEAWSGKAPTGGQLNASAIIALQEAAGIRIRGIQRRLHKAIRDIGEIWLAHWKEFYTEERIFRIVGEDNQTGYVWFKGTDYADMQFDIKVQAGTSSPFSKSVLMANLDKMLEAGVITPDEYLELLPVDIFPKAQQLLQRRKETGGLPGQPEEVAAIMQVAQQAAQQTVQQEVAALVQQLPEMVVKVVNDVINEMAQQMAQQQQAIQGQEILPAQPSF
jgi:hypothetical protein